MNEELVFGFVNCAELPRPKPVIHIDGFPHTHKEETGCCAELGRVCPKCKHWMHFQPVFEGVVYKCEFCLREE